MSLYKKKANSIKNGNFLFLSKLSVLQEKIFLSFLFQHKKDVQT